MIKFNIKKQEIKPEFLHKIKSGAYHLSLYDPRFPESDQCGGYVAFKELCMSEEIPVKDDLSWSNFHPLLRPAVLKMLGAVKNPKIKILSYDSDGN
jgi:hypothetical protein